MDSYVYPMKYALLILIAAGGSVVPCTAQENTAWMAYGCDPGGMRFATGTQINTGNVSRLKVAWKCRTGEVKHNKGTIAEEIAAFEATPLMVDGVLYISTPTDRVVAINAANGMKKWIYDPDVNLDSEFPELTSRGVATWPGPETDGGARRIFVATIDGRLIALDATSGKPIASFGDQGQVDLSVHHRRVAATSPPAIIGNTLVVGSSMIDNSRFDAARGTVRAYDVIDGTLKWSWDPIPRDASDPAYQTWRGDNVQLTGAANVWSLISADPERDMIFIPTSCASPDYYGGERKGRNLYANSVVALRASTGEMLWYFQTVRHDIWDYDVAAQPLLFDFPRDGKMIPAVAVGTKMGHIFILDRETGEPLMPVEERRVPQKVAPGEEPAPTQLFPVMPKPVGLQHVGPEVAWGLTVEDSAKAAARIDSLHYEGIFTPASFQGTLVSPSNIGGIHWGGMTYDPEQKLLVTNINRIAAIITLIPREDYRDVVAQHVEMARAQTGLMEGTPYVMVRDYLFNVEGKRVNMQSQPPWGTLLAIELPGGELKWEVPLGFMMNPLKHREAVKWGSVNLGGALTTAGGLTFVAATLDGFFRAFDTSTGEMLWHKRLPVPAMATPMSYVLNGKQYIVIASGGHGKLRTKLSDYVVAYTIDGH